MKPLRNPFGITDPFENTKSKGVLFTVKDPFESFEPFNND